MRASGPFRAFDLVLVVALVAVLALDGLVALPAGFETFKDRLPAIAATVLAAGLIAASVLTGPRERPPDVSTG